MSLIEEETPTQCSLLVEHNFISSCHNSKKIDVVEPKHLFLECVFLAYSLFIYILANLNHEKLLLLQSCSHCTDNNYLTYFNTEENITVQSQMLFVSVHTFSIHIPRKKGK